MGNISQPKLRALGIEVLVRRNEAARSAVPQSIVNYVARTHEFVILDDAAQSRFGGDTYFSQNHVRSVLCLPLITQGKLVAVMYLENSLASRVFTTKRISVLKLLAAQVSISLENTQLYADLMTAREAKIRRLVDANIMAVVIWRLDGAIVGSNEAFLRMVQYDREDVATGRVRWTDLTPTEWREHDERTLAEIRATGTVQPYEKELLRKDGSRVPVLVAGTLFEEGGSEGVAFALDLSEQKQQEAERERLRQQLGHLEHLNRVSTMEELTASLAHEIKQPIGAAVTNAEACLR